RTKMRMEQLDQMQRDLIAAFNPAQYGYTGILGYHSDYVYSFLIQDKDPKALEKWESALRDKFSNTFELNNGMHINTNISVGAVRLTADHEDSYDALMQAKAALSQAMKSDKSGV